MKALLLAAGMGTRLGQITKDIPKPMLQIDDKPILEHNLRLCKNIGIKTILINLHYLPDTIINYFGDGTKFGVDIKYNYEEELLGTAGALLDFQYDIGREPFFVLYGDNYTKFNLLDLKRYNNHKNGDVSILFHWRNNVSNSGISIFDESEKIIEFIEKPTVHHNDGDWVNAGIYYFENDTIFKEIQKYDDFAKDLFPKLIANNYDIYGLKDNVELLSVDTPEMLDENINKLLNKE